MPRVVKQQAKGPTKKSRGSGVWGRVAPVGTGEEGLKVNIYGRSGTGKTTLAGAFPKPLLHIVCSAIRLGESLSLRGVQGIDDVELSDSTDLRELVNGAVDQGYQTVVLDHATGLQDLLLREIMGIDELPAQRSWGMATREQYGQCSLQTKEMLRALLKLPTNVVIVAQEREFNAEGDGELLMPYVASALTPSVTGWLNPAVDYICQTFIRPQTREVSAKIGGKQVKRREPIKGRSEYCLRTGPDPTYTTKFRLPRGTPLPDVVVDPSYDAIRQLIQGD